MRILHVNDIANVGATLVEGLTRLGHDAELRRLRPDGQRRSTLVKLLASPARRKVVGRQRQVESGSYDVVHIHFATWAGWHPGPVSLLSALSRQRRAPRPARPIAALADHDKPASGAAPSFS